MSACRKRRNSSSRYLDWATIPLAHFANAETKALNQKQEADIRATAGADRRLADLDAMGVDVQMIAPPPPQCYYTVPLDIAVQGGAAGQRRHRRVLRQARRPLQGIWHGADAGRP